MAACSRDRVVRVFDARTGALLRELPHPALALIQASVTPGEAVSQQYWEALGEGPLAIHRRQEPAPLVHFHDAMEAAVFLRDGLMVGRGRTEKDVLYVLKLHAPPSTP